VTAIPDPPIGFDALSVKVGALDDDVREINDRLLGLDTKIDKAVSSLAHEFRTALAALTTQLSERNRTPWAVLFAGAAVVISVLAMFGSQALSPVLSDIKNLKEQIVPRVENDFRNAEEREHFARLEAWVKRLEERRYDELIRENERLRGVGRAMP
jgi:HPt (histidine-containing phosphotransfer) domain-containing protein